MSGPSAVQDLVAAPARPGWMARRRGRVDAAGGLTLRAAPSRRASGVSRVPGGPVVTVVSEGAPNSP
ncbi:hypothetical protein [Streptosporangium sp. NPDC004631]